MRYYIINLSRNLDRKERITRRLKYYHLLERTTFIQAIDQDDPLVDKFQFGAGKISKKIEHACFLSHLKALRTMILEKEASAIILEDDALLRNNWNDQLISLQDKIVSAENKPNLILFSPYVTKKEWKVHPEINNLFQINGSIYGAVGYWLNRPTAEKIIQQYGHPARYLPERRITSETFLQSSGGYFINPPLVIEESFYSNIQTEAQLENHRKYFKQFGYQNYLQSEDEEIMATIKEWNNN